MGFRGRIKRGVENPFYIKYNFLALPSK